MLFRMEDDPRQPPEAALIEGLRQGLGKKQGAVSRVAKAAGISEGRWRQLAKGYQQATAETRIPAIAPADTLARMAHSVGATPDQLRGVHREDAAEALERMETVQADPLAHMPANVRETIEKVAAVELPRGAYFAPTLSALDQTLAARQPTEMSAAERKLLVSARNKLLKFEELTAEESAVLTRHIEEDELRTLHARINWLPRAEQLEVSALVNDLGVRVEERVRGDGFTNEDERWPDYAQPNPLPVEGAQPEQKFLPNKVEEIGSGVETEKKSDASAEAVKVKEERVTKRRRLLTPDESAPDM